MRASQRPMADAVAVVPLTAVNSEQVRKAVMARRMVQMAMEDIAAVVAVVVWAARRRHLPTQGQMVVRGQPTLWRELPTLLREVVGRDPTVLVASAKRVAVLAEMEIKMDRVHQVEQMLQQIQGQGEAAAAAIMGLCMAAQAARVL